MVDRRVLGRLLDVHDLPTLPEVMTRILQTLEDEHSSASDLTVLLECDHAISARVLRLANSAFYGLRHRVGSIQHAVVMLGFDAVRHLALATSVFDTLAKRQQFALDPEDFWMHALGAAKATHYLCGKGSGLGSVESLFTAGLLHDIGKYYLALALKEEYREIVEEAERLQCPLREVEQDRLGATSAEIGRLVATNWRFPEVIIDAIGACTNVRKYLGEWQTEVAVVAVADDVSRRAGFGYAGDRQFLTQLETPLDVLSLTEEDVDEAVEELRGVLDETRAFLNLLAEE
jgi:HD-like signal output (HDOD) protein